MRRLLNIKHPSVVEWLVEGDITMAIEYCIQIENRPRHLSPHSVDRDDRPNMQSATGQHPVDGNAPFGGPRNSSSHGEHVQPAAGRTRMVDDA